MKQKQRFQTPFQRQLQTSNGQLLIVQNYRFYDVLLLTSDVQTWGKKALLITLAKVTLFRLVQLLNLIFFSEGGPG